MSVLIKNMEIPKTGLYFVSVDNTNGRDKTVITVERMLGNRDVRQIVGSFELVQVPEPHRDLIDTGLQDWCATCIHNYGDSCEFGERCMYQSNSVGTYNRDLPPTEYEEK